MGEHSAGAWSVTVTSVCATHTWEQLQGTGSFAGGVGGGCKADINAPGEVARVSKARVM